MVAGGEVPLRGKAMHTLFLLGLGWVFLFHKCNERKHIIVTIKLVGLRGIPF